MVLNVLFYLMVFVEEQVIDGLLGMYFVVFGNGNSFLKILWYRQFFLEVGVLYGKWKFVVFSCWLLICLVVIFFRVLIQLQLMLLENCFFWCQVMLVGRQDLKYLCRMCFFILLLLYILFCGLMCIVMLRNFLLRNGMWVFMFQVDIVLLVWVQLNICSVCSLCIVFLCSFLVFGVLWKQRQLLNILFEFLLESIILMFMVLIFCDIRYIGVEV